MYHFLETTRLLIFFYLYLIILLNYSLEGSFLRVKSIVKKIFGQFKEKKEICFCQREKKSANATSTGDFWS